MRMEWKVVIKEQEDHHVGLTEPAAVLLQVKILQKVVHQKEVANHPQKVAALKVHQREAANLPQAVAHQMALLKIHQKEAANLLQKAVHQKVEIKAHQKAHQKKQEADQRQQLAHLKVAPKERVNQEGVKDSPEVSY